LPMRYLILALPVLLLTTLIGSPVFSAIGNHAFPSEKPTGNDPYLSGLVAYYADDFVTALNKWTPIAKQGNADAQKGLGWLYNEGKGVPRDYKIALKWFTLAAEHQMASAPYYLAGMYLDGHGVLRDSIRAYMWFSIAASLKYEIANQELNLLKRSMSATQIKATQSLVRECVKKMYRGC
ncbi:MAG: sel1 repeat family protein, partial [Betaproteobacteria bacterium]|nr:sel1 repeat family protein [Betaproteobacteria bacterium]